MSPQSAMDDAVDSCFRHSVSSPQVLQGDPTRRIDSADLSDLSLGEFGVAVALSSGRVLAPFVDAIPDVVRVRSGDPVVWSAARGIVAGVHDNLPWVKFSDEIYKSPAMGKSGRSLLGRSIVEIEGPVSLLHTAASPRPAAVGVALIDLCPPALDQDLMANHLKISHSTENT